MFLFRLLSFIFGYVNMLVKGDNLEKFLNMAASRGIYLWDIKKIGENEILVKTRLSAVRPLRHIGRNARSRFTFKGREGLPFMVNRIKKRKSLIIGAVFFLSGLYALSSFIWFIDVKGNQQLPADRILKTAAGAGLKVGACKFKLDQEQVESVIRECMPEVSYVGVIISGTRATIEIAEKIIIQKEQLQPAHIVAKKAGLIKEVLVLVGHPAVKEGDTVVPGQILISGVIPPPDQQDPGPAGDVPGGGVKPEPPAPPTYVHARGLVRARIWYEGYGEAPLVEEGTRETGESFSRVCIKIAGKEIILSGTQKIPFNTCKVQREVKKPPSWRNLSIPVELISEKYLEIKDYRENRSRAEALELARQKALASARAGITGEVRVIEEKTSEVTLKNPENLVRVRAYIETLEDIGLEKPIK
ncbi:MAG: sporulation protein YqfD [Peptococcaceae bacterium]|nr:sporulation protein YqfD [Peptococcaceae bacterium]